MAQKLSAGLNELACSQMPIEIKVYSKSSDFHFVLHTFLNLMLGSKDFNNILNVVGLKEWSWVNPYYEFEIEKSLEEIKSIQLDPENQLLMLIRTIIYL